MLYDVKSICAKVVLIPEYKDIKKEVVAFFSGDNLYNKLGLSEIYTHNHRPGVFIKEQDLLQLFLLAKNKFKTDFNVNVFTEGYACIKKVDDSDKSLTKHTISSHEQVKKIVKEHAEKSAYGKQLEKDKNNPNEKKARRQQEHKDFIKAAYESKKAFWAGIENQTNLGQNFSELKVVSVDFEFTLNKENKSCLVTECGISVSDKGELSSQHYLIQGNHLQKSKYAIERQQTFAFGETIVVPESLIPDILKTALDGVDVVVFHEKREDEEILNGYGVNLEEYKNVQVMDTQWCYKKHFMDKRNKMVGMSIEQLLEGFKIPAKDLHNAGNDAYYTLQLLLKMSQIYILRENLSQNKNSDVNKPKI